VLKGRAANRRLLRGRRTRLLNRGNSWSFLALYTIRMLAGAPATWTPISPWLAAFSIFFLTLTIVKRFSGVPGLKFGASPMGEECDFKYLGIDTSHLI
jgi:hypothetical protein